MPARWLANAVVTIPTSSGPANDVTFPDSANSPKNCVILSAGASRTSSVRAAACSGPAAIPMNSPMAMKNFSAGAANSPAPAHRRRDRNNEQDMIAARRKDRDSREQQNDEAAEHHGLGPDTIVELAAHIGADRCGDRQQDAEHADLDRAPAEGAGRIDAAEREQREQRVGVDHVGEQEHRDIAVLRQPAQRHGEFAQAVRHGGAERHRGRPVRREGKQRQDEHHEPHRAQRPDRAVALAQHGIEPEQRREAEQRLAGVRVGGEEAEHEDEAMSPPT